MGLIRSYTALRHAVTVDKADDACEGDILAAQFVMETLRVGAVAEDEYLHYFHGLSKALEKQQVAQINVRNLNLHTSKWEEIVSRFKASASADEDVAEAQAIITCFLKPHLCDRCKKNCPETHEGICWDCREIRSKQEEEEERLKQEAAELLAEVDDEVRCSVCSADHSAPACEDRCYDCGALKNQGPGCQFCAPAKKTLGTIFSDKLAGK